MDSTHWFGNFIQTRTQNRTKSRTQNQTQARTQNAKSRNNRKLKFDIKWRNVTLNLVETELESASWVPRVRLLTSSTALLVLVSLLNLSALYTSLKDTRWQGRAHAHFSTRRTHWAPDVNRKREMRSSKISQTSVWGTYLSFTSSEVCLLYDYF